MDTIDSFKCFRAADGKEAWVYQYPALGQLDFGNSPQPRPSFMATAFSFTEQSGISLAWTWRPAKVIWQMDIRDQFDAKDERKLEHVLLATHRGWEAHHPAAKTRRSSHWSRRPAR